ncbi:carbamoyltransferase [Danxiaibacter flavus]|uniref:Carbamoyltransferase n=1 Tax=Danxiaibacter flavus TaxID=3049108 RepID=A0ABV3ZIE3_9BACT|nr:carbamoyltransferase [Chitinophagaceae bacterium DXS]
MGKAILGISAFYHDSAAALIVDGEIIAAAQEERFTRIKHDASFPKNAVEYVLQEAGLVAEDLYAIAFYDKPLLKFERLLETYHAFAPKGLSSFLKAMRVWIKEKLFIKKALRKELKQISNKVPVLFPEHHLSHAASAFYPSPFEDAAILTIDGVGEWATTTISHGSGKSIKILRELQFPHSIGLLYSAFTYYLGFKVNSGEYKLMGLAPYGNAASLETENFKKKIFEEIVDLRQDGSVILNMDYFNYAAGLTMTNDAKWESALRLARRAPEAALNQSHMNLALAAQQALEEIIIRLARTAKEITGSKNLVMAGGVALNCVSNSKLVNEKIFENVWIQPAAGDAGGALGAAFAAWHIWANEERKYISTDKMQAAYLGPQFDVANISRIMHKYGATAERYDSFEQLTSAISKKIADGKVVGWFQGRMEFGPRALGNRSILADPRNPAMQKQLNLKIKSREGFRPFAPSVLAEDASCYFENAFPSPYMLFVAYLKEHLRKPLVSFDEQTDMYARLNSLRSDVPAITHLDFSARVQTVDKTSNPKFWQLIHDFKKLTGCSMLINTSFNVRGEPIVCTPIDAYRCFMRTEMDYLVIENYVFDKTTQPEFVERTSLFEPD